MIKITYDDLNTSSPLTTFIFERYGPFGEFSPLDISENVQDLCWFIGACELCQTIDMLKLIVARGASVFTVAKCLYKIYDPDYSLIDYFMRICKSPTVAGWLIVNCEHSQTEEMISFWKSLNPSTTNVWWLMYKCEYCRTDEMMEYLKTLNPSSYIVGKLIADFDIYQTEEMSKYYYEISK